MENAANPVAQMIKITVRVFGLSPGFSFAGSQSAQRRVRKAEKQQSLDEPKRSRGSYPPKRGEIVEIRLTGAQMLPDVSVIHDEVSDEGIDDKHVDDEGGIPRRKSLSLTKEAGPRLARDLAAK